MVSDSDSDILARTLYGEARGEGQTGMRAVACVVMNRVNRPGWWGDSIASVCQKPWQFSCWNAGDPNRAIIEKVDAGDAIFAAALEIAKSAGDVEDITDGATSYYDRRMQTPPVWASQMIQCAAIGHHLFFKEKS